MLGSVKTATRRRYSLGFKAQGMAECDEPVASVAGSRRPAQHTVLHYIPPTTVGGKIAQLGSRLVDMAAQKMATEYFETFNAKLRERYQVAPEPVVPEPVVPEPVVPEPVVPEPVVPEPVVPAAPQGLLV